MSIPVVVNLNPVEQENAVGMPDSLIPSVRRRPRKEHLFLVFFCRKRAQKVSLLFVCANFLVERRVLSLTGVTHAHPVSPGCILHGASRKADPARDFGGTRHTEVTADRDLVSDSQRTECDASLASQQQETTFREHMFGIFVFFFLCFSPLMDNRVTGGESERERAHRTLFTPH